MGAGEDHGKRGEINENMKTYLSGWHFTATSLSMKEDKMMLVSPGISCSKKGLIYDAESYPYIAVKIPHLPENHKKDWLGLSYSVMSAPEFWTFHEADAQVIDGDVYMFRETKSGNGTLFFKATSFCYLNFGFRCDRR